MTTKAEYTRGLDAQLRAWDSTIAAWSAKADVATAAARIGYECELDSLRSKRAVAHGALGRLAASNDTMWEDLKDNTERIWKRMGKAMEAGATRFG